MKSAIVIAIGVLVLMGCLIWVSLENKALHTDRAAWVDRARDYAQETTRLRDVGKAQDKVIENQAEWIESLERTIEVWEGFGAGEITFALVLRGDDVD